MTGLSLAQARSAMSLGWPEGLLRDLSTMLRANEAGVGFIGRSVIEVRAPGQRYAFWRSGGGNQIDAVALLLDLADPDPSPLTVFTDGSGTHDPNAPAGAGIVFYVDGVEGHTWSIHAGNGTNNHAELAAVHFALGQVRDLDRPVKLWTDSKYAIEACSAPSYTARANTALIAALREEVALRPHLLFLHVKGHQKVTPETALEEAFAIRGNARADELAGNARRRALGQPEKAPPKPRVAQPPKVEVPPKQRPIGKMKRASMPRRLTS